MTEQENNIKFVKEVQKHPCLYDYRLMEYGRKYKTEAAWNKVGQELNLTGPQCKEKWKNLRTVLSRHLKPSTKLKRPYYLAEAMQFAIPFIKSLTSSIGRPNIDQPDPIAVCSSDCEEEAEESELQANSSPSESCYSSPLQIQSPQPFQSHTCHASVPTDASKRTLQLSADCEDNIYDYFKRKRAKFDKKNGIDRTDAVKAAKEMFLLSLLPDLYAMDAAQMRSFRIKVLTLIDDVLQTPMTNEFCEVTPQVEASHVVKEEPTVLDTNSDD